MMDKARDALERLIFFCEEKRWAGYDPFDGLNSRAFSILPFLNKSRRVRLAFLQLNKRSPVNLRPFLGVKAGRNPKGLGLFLSAALRMFAATGEARWKRLAERFIAWLLEAVSPGYCGPCWGYDFPWQSRAFYLPRGTPTVVNTSFIGKAFVEAYRVLGDDSHLDTARKACDFILKDLNRLEGDETLAFSYSPLDRYFVHNATALAGSLLSAVSRITGESHLARAAEKSLRHVVRHQNRDGSWHYGEDAVARKTGVDSFHTGFILESLTALVQDGRNEDFERALKKGVGYYQERFFLEDGRAKYFPHSLYPIDVHCSAQGIVTLLKCRDWGADRDLCARVLRWMIDNMQDRKGFFYYQKKRFYTIKIPYMRWTQAWAFYALATYLSHKEDGNSRR